MLGLALYRGTLHGMGRIADCDLVAWKPSEPDRSEFRVIFAPLDLPDGEYQVEFDGRCGPGSKKQGRWQVGRCQPASRKRTEQRPAA